MLDDLGQLLQQSGVGLGSRRERGNHSAHDLEAVTVGEVSERIVVGDQDAAIRRHCVENLGDLGIGDFQGFSVGIQAAVDGVGIGAGMDQLVGQFAQHSGDALRIEPDVGVATAVVVPVLVLHVPVVVVLVVVVPVLVMAFVVVVLVRFVVVVVVSVVVVPTAELEFDGVDVLRHLEHMHALGRDSFQGVVEALLETQAVRHHQVGCAHRLAVSQRRLVGVRIPALRDEGGYRHAVLATHVADHVAPDARRSDHRWHCRGCICRVSRVGIGIGSRACSSEQRRSRRHHQSALADPSTPPLTRASFDRHLCLPYAPIQVWKSPSGALASPQVLRMRTSFSYPIEA